MTEGIYDLSSKQKIDPEQIDNGPTAEDILEVVNQFIEQGE